MVILLSTLWLAIEASCASGRLILAAHRGPSVRQRDNLYVGGSHSQAHPRHRRHLARRRTDRPRIHKQRATNPLDVRPMRVAKDDDVRIGMQACQATDRPPI